MTRLNTFEWAMHAGRPGGPRAGVLATPHGTVETPAFIPVGTKATVKGVLPGALREAGVQIVLANAYHLALRPGAEVIRRLGGLHAVMNWDGPLLTDSGGFQVFSLAPLRRVAEEGVLFRSPVDGAEMMLTPESAVATQNDLGADILMALDVCPPYPCPRAEVEQAVRLTLAWAARSLAAHQREDQAGVPRLSDKGGMPTPPLRGHASGEGENMPGERRAGHATPDNGAVPESSGTPGQALWAIVQGGVERDLRERCAAGLVAMNFPGYAIGGVSVGEGHERLKEVVGWTAPLLPADRPRYLMGVGEPGDVVAAVGAGMDLFDCVLPTRNGRNACAFTFDGVLRLRNEVHKTDRRPIEEDCDCPACRAFSRGALRHLFAAEEMLGPMLVSMHNIRFFTRFFGRLRQAILEGRFAAEAQGLLDRYYRNG